MKSANLYFLIHKPFKVLSQFTDEDNNPGLGSIYNLPKDVYPVGRLDLDSEGLLILTNDRHLNHKLLDPKFKHRRTYHVEVEGIPSKDAIAELKIGVLINLKGKKHKTAQCDCQLLEVVPLVPRDPDINRKKHPVTSWIEVILTEGKNRQVRRMTASVGHPTLRLVRVGIEKVELSELPPGAIKQISQSIIYQSLNITK
ncbi:MAG: 23S rRNA pseudouridine2457 synthase [Cyclobacteriaceae bacterium]|jgi:23S rRNA pseudouridine2457 synthase